MGAINPKVIADLRALEAGGAPGLLRELIDLYVREADGHMTRLRNALESRDAHAFTRSVHTLKGSSGNLGAMQLSGICGELQTAGHAADWDRISTLLPGLEAEYRDSRAELLQERTKP
jgi:HPt (histidine-containing phosphotransfer) domain-containing protein